MAAITTILAAGALAVGAASAVAQQQASSKQAKAQQAASAAQSRAANVESQRARIQQVREARIRRGAITAAGENAGLGAGTSGIGGAVGSVASQMGANIGAINVQQTFADQTSAALQKAADYGVEAQKWQTIGGFGKSIFADAGGFTTIFGGNTSKKAGS